MSQHFREQSRLNFEFNGSIFISRKSKPPITNFSALLIEPSTFFFHPRRSKKAFTEKKKEEAKIRPFLRDERPMNQNSTLSF